jgi:hypothetical protein
MSERKTLRRYNNGQYIDQRQHDSTLAAITPVLNSQIVYGNLVTATVVSGLNVISHNLGRPYTMWIIAGTSNAATAPNDNATNTMPDKVLVLNCSASGTIKIWIA